MTSHQSTKESKKITWNRNSWILVLGIIFIAATLRSPLTSVGPIISYIKDGLDISNVLAGFITTIPLLAFAIVSPFAPKFSRIYGFEKTLLFAMVILTVGIFSRSLGNTFFLLLGTALIGIAIAFGNVLLPALIKLKFPLQVGLLTSIFTVAMNIMASIAAGISYPIANTSFGWKGALGCWIILAIIAIIIWLPQLRQKVEIKENHSHAKLSKPIWKYPLTWAITFAMGLQSLIFYTTAAWIPAMLESQGMSPSQSGWMFSIMQFSQLPMTFLIPILAGRRSNQRSLVAMFGIFYIVGFAGILMNWTALTIVWMILLGLAGGASFGLAMMFFSLRSRNALEAAELSGTAQSIGYLLAAAGPVLYGYIHDLWNSWHAANILYALTVIGLLIASWISAKDRYVTADK
ncbi:CynX/NimT family MFS transporter [Rummeliibacillus pycnus]|uniref:CynX/NimT family MFS transporter n=1 Tax=Rummeliibacillus pycnus TaxID=101070 RepID=UPI000C9B8E17|nr:MFS transporter [Rummeliibacillus pycnus]